MAGLQFCTCTAGVQHECVMCGPALCVLHVLYSEGLAEVNRHLYNTYCVLRGPVFSVLQVFGSEGLVKVHPYNLSYRDLLSSILEHSPQFSLFYRCWRTESCRECTPGTFIYTLHFRHTRRHRCAQA